MAPLCLGVSGDVPCVENRRWIVGGVTYATLNIQGSCNNLCDTAPDPLDMLRAFEVIAVFGFFEPAPLRVGFAGLAASGLGTETLTRHVTVIGMVEGLTV